MKRLLIALAFLFCLAAPVSAALPPLDSEQRESDSSAVFRGEIISITTRKKKLSDGSSNLELELEIVVKESLKGNFVQQSTVRVKCWTVDKRPDDWVGDGGQRPLPQEGDLGTFYVIEPSPGDFRLLEPNGWDRD